MAKFVKGISGNPTGRPRAAEGLRQLLAERYGQNGEIIVNRLEKRSRGRDAKLAHEADKLMLGYLVGPPAVSVELSGSLMHGKFEIVSLDAMSRLTSAQLDALATLNGLTPEALTAAEPDES